MMTAYPETLLEIRTDAPDLAEPLFEGLARDRIPPPLLTPLRPEDALISRFSVARGTSMDEARASFYLIRIAALLARLGIDQTRYPLERTEAKSARTVITLPLRACKERRCPAYAGHFPERFPVELAVDDRTLGREFQQALQHAGFRVSRRLLIDPTCGLTITHPKAANHPQITDALRDLLEAAMSLVTTDISAYDITCVESDDDSSISVQAPLAAIRDGRLLDAIGAPSRFKLHIFAREPEVAEPVREVFASWGFRSLKVGKLHRTPAIRFGGAPRALITRIAAAVGSIYAGLRLPFEKAWDQNDMDVYVELPATLSAPARPITPPRPAIVPRATSRAGRPFMMEDDGDLRIGQICLRRRRSSHPLVPSAAGFRSYCIDQTTAESLDRLAEAVARSEPGMLEGGTASSKTSSILLFAAMLGQPVHRINLHRQSDAADLIGRFVPGGSGWHWQDGPLPVAMTEGHWVLLDEVNLAAASDIERINPVLELPHPMLVLSENDGRCIGSARHPVHPEFRIFATLNPSEGYAGRSELSPAFKDRFVAFRHVPSPSEKDILDLLRLLVFGVQPDVVVNSVAYTGARDCAAPCARLAQIPRIERVLEALARFHVGAETACMGTDAGTPGEAAAVITRRSLIATIRAFEQDIEAARRNTARVLLRHIETYYLARTKPHSDMRKALENLLLAHGLPVKA